MLRTFIVAGLRGAVVSAFISAPALAADDFESGLAVCASCHGENGAPTMAIAPVICGQQPGYLYKELHDYHSGARRNALMAPVVQSFSLADLRRAAEYFASRPWPSVEKASAAPASPPEGAAACQGCHGKTFEGSAMAPHIAGLNYQYLISAMNNFAQENRSNSDDMMKFMKALSVPQRETIAHYLAAL